MTGREVAAYTRGRGRLNCALRGYEPCADQESIVAQFSYDPERDVENTPDSVFCSHGAGVNVKWSEALDHMHVDSGLRLGLERPRQAEAPPVGRQRTRTRSGSLEQDKELQAIFERTYGKVGVAGPSNPRKWRGPASATRRHPCPKDWAGVPACGRIQHPLSLEAEPAQAS